ncbi:calcium ion binding protein [Aureococcus anophagefferens]|nr:calcium ion binding protein [Aureococcus anophagefferens]
MKNCVGSPPPAAASSPWASGERSDDAVFDVDEDTAWHAVVAARSTVGATADCVERAPARASGRAVHAGALDDDAGGAVTVTVVHGAEATYLTNETWSLGWTDTMAPTVERRSAPRRRSDAGRRAAVSDPSSSAYPTPSPSSVPTSVPRRPDALAPTAPSGAPTAPTSAPTPAPTSVPTAPPTALPTSAPTPSIMPTPLPTPATRRTRRASRLAGLYGPWGDGQFLVERLVTFAFPTRGPGRSDRGRFAPRALESPCGHGDGFPPQAAAFDHPAGVALYARPAAAATRDRRRRRRRADDAAADRRPSRLPLPAPTAWPSLSAAPTEGTPAPVAAAVLCADVGRSLCVAPETCACAPGWAGADCGDPSAPSGGCVAPDTCQCGPHWHGHDCSLPVCHQGFFAPFLDAEAPRRPPPDRPLHWPSYRPCFSALVQRGRGFDCAQLRRPAPPSRCPAAARSARPRAGATGPDRCDIFGRRVLRVNVTQGVYACANGGNCTAPDVCRCAEGWSGFDCRTPICDQGYYAEDQASFVSGTEDPDEVAYFERFLDPNVSAYRRTWPYSNPDFVLDEEVFDDFDGGGYRCSLRARTRWERPELVFDHVNFYSRYMDAKVERDGEKYTNWSHMAWPPTHAKTAKLEITHTLANDRQVTYIYTNEGHRRDGVWEVTGEELRANQIFNPTSIRVDFDVTELESSEVWPRRPGSPVDFHTGEEWTEGTCIVEFRRVCGSAPVVVEEDDLGVPEFYVEDLASKARAFLEDRAYDLDISSKTLRDVDVQDTDFAYRPRIVYDDARAYGQDSAWSVVGGECVDTVLRGCFNNGTCVAPGTCRCARGWEGDDCSVPVCAQACHHHGNCTMPDECTCEAGWEGHDCSTPVCAQECYHNGLCVAPDTCKCRLWESNWPSGHTAEVFTLNVGPAAAIRTKMQDAISVSYGATNYEPLGYRELGGRGYDGREDIITEDGQRLLKCDMKPRCPSYDEMVVSNVGESFPQACGYDVLETGCCARVYPNATADEARCIENDPNDKACVDVGTYYCQYCEEENKHYAPNNFTCAGSDTVTSAEAAVEVNIYDYAQVPPMFRSGRQTSSQIRICGQTKKHMNYEEVFSLRPDYDDYKPNDPRPNSTSHAFLCGVTAWVQGDYIDDGGLCDDFGDCAAAAGVGIRYGPGRALDRVDRGRHVRVNTPNITRVEGGYGQDDVGPTAPSSAARASTSARTAARASRRRLHLHGRWAGFDCTTPLCRHLQYPSGYISACENGGVCKYKDTCSCIQAPSMLTVKYAPRRHDGLDGHGLRHAHRRQLDTFDEEKIDLFERNPCSLAGARRRGDADARDATPTRAESRGVGARPSPPEARAPRDDDLDRSGADSTEREARDGPPDRRSSAQASTRPGPCPTRTAARGPAATWRRGATASPNECTCWCKNSYNEDICLHKRAEGVDSHACRGPYQDLLGYETLKMFDLVNYRNLLEPTQTFGTRACTRGFEGTVNQTFDRYMTCHLKIFIPNSFEAWTLTWLIVASIVTVVVVVTYCYVRRKMKKKYLQAKIERRRSRRSSEESARSSQQKDAFKTT